MHHRVLHLVILGALCLQLVCGRARAASLANHDTTCSTSCVADGLRLQLIRGEADQLAKCDDGFYCDCQTKETLHCDMIMGLARRFNERDQKCDFDFDVDCAADLDDGGGTPTTDTTTTPTTRPCTCDSTGPDRQLIRGDGQVAQCQSGYYCECASRTVAQCDSFLGMPSMFDEENQECAFYFDCEGYLNEDSSPTPSEPQTTSAAPDVTTSVPGSCVCQSGGKNYQLIRGDDEVHKCETGLYCNCRQNTVQHCDTLIPGTEMHYNEEMDMCDFTFDCESYLNAATTPSVTPPQVTTPSLPETTPSATDATTEVSEPCVCQSTGKNYQLIRGEDEVQKCESGLYCDCQKKTVQHCDSLMPGTEMHFNEEMDMCDFTFDCESYLNAPTMPSVTPPQVTTPSLPETTPSATDATTEVSERCVCQSTGKNYQLIRGQDEVQKCESGLYCDCQKKNVLKCDAQYGAETVFDEGIETCTFSFDCKAFLQGTTLAPVTTPSTIPPVTKTTPTQPDVTTRDPKSCVCKSRGRNYQLIRGQDEVHKCESGYYCDCQNNKVLQCSSGFFGFRKHFNEKMVRCEITFSCKSFLKITTLLPVTTPSFVGTTLSPPDVTTKTHESCVCKAGGTKNQLMRGQNEVQKCKDGYYCDCANKNVLHCDGVFMGLTTSYNEDIDLCEFSFDCESFFKGTTMAPLTTPSAIPPVTKTTSTQPEVTTKSPESCACQLEGKNYQLIRGEDEVEKCEDGLYCDCRQKTVLQCDSPMAGTDMHYNEEMDMCDFTFDCESYLSTPTLAPATPSSTSSPVTETVSPASDVTTGAPESCACQSGGKNYQLIRGEDEVKKCEDGLYCDCRQKTVLHCDSPMPGTGMQFNEEMDMCEFTFDCASFLQRPTTSPSSSIWPEPTPQQTCVCESSTTSALDFQLIRGQDQLSYCERGYYCACRSQTVLQCDYPVIYETAAATFDENTQMCEYTFDCGAFFGGDIGSSSTGTPPVTHAPTPPSPNVVTTSSAMPWYSILFALALLFTVVNVGILWGLKYWSNNRRRPHAFTTAHPDCFVVTSELPGGKHEEGKV